MDRKASKRPRGIPIQRNTLPYWDDEGGVFTQERPRGSAGKKSSQSVGESLIYKLCL